MFLLLDLGVQENAQVFGSATAVGVGLELVAVGADVGLEDFGSFLFVT